MLACVCLCVWVCFCLYVIIVFYWLSYSSIQLLAEDCLINLLVHSLQVRDGRTDGRRRALGRRGSHSSDVFTRLRLFLSSSRDQPRPRRIYGRRRPGAVRRLRNDRQPVRCLGGCCCCCIVSPWMMVADLITTNGRHQAWTPGEFIVTVRLLHHHHHHHHHLYSSKTHNTKAVIENCGQDKLGNSTYNCPKNRDESIKTIKRKNN